MSKYCLFDYTKFSWRPDYFYHVFNVFGQTCIEYDRRSASGSHLYSTLHSLPLGAYLYTYLSWICQLILDCLVKTRLLTDRGRMAEASLCGVRQQTHTFYFKAICQWRVLPMEQGVFIIFANTWCHHFQLSIHIVFSLILPLRPMESVSTYNRDWLISDVDEIHFETFPFTPFSELF